MPTVARVFWLPVTAYWLNPIDKLWRKLHQEVLHLHRVADDWKGLVQAIRTFLDQFATGLQQLLHYVGLLGDGRLARARRGDPAPTDLQIEK